MNLITISMCSATMILTYSVIDFYSVKGLAKWQIGLLEIQQNSDFVQCHPLYTIFGPCLYVNIAVTGQMKITIFMIISLNFEPSKQNIILKRNTLFWFRKHYCSMFCDKMRPPLVVFLSPP